MIVGKKYGDNIRGTYIHSDLIFSMISSISAMFAIKMTKIINQYVVNEAMIK
jgi:hypothetical protein